MFTLTLTPGRRPDEIHARFPYDPPTIAAVRSVPGAHWDKLQRVWILPRSPEAVDALRLELRRNGGRTTLRATPALIDELAARARNVSVATQIKRAGDATAWPLRSTPYAHQRAGLAFLERLGSGALLWEMGTGKTAAAIAYAETLAAVQPIHVLVITPNSVKRNWGVEIEKHAGHTHFVVPDGTLVQRAKQLGSERYTIVNPEALSLAPLSKAILDHPWDMVIVDESTRFKTPGAKRTKALHKLRPEHRVILTGTPITGKAQDAWAQLEWVQPGLFGKWWSFVDSYLLKDQWHAIVGVRPTMAEPLRQKIESRSYRVLKRDVLDLPAKVFETREVELGVLQRHYYRQMQEELRVEIEGAERTSASTILTQLLRLTQITAGMVGEAGDYLWLGSDNAKLQELGTLLNDELAGEQVVIFGLYQKELEKLAAHFGAAEAIVYGPTPEQRRAELVAQFQSGARRLLFVQSHTGGIGINLTAASTAIYYSRSWSLEDWLQSQDRLHRIGQTRSVTIVSLAARDTIDQTIAATLNAKQSLADTLTGDALRRLTADLLHKES